MIMNRRQFLAGAGGLSAAAVLGGCGGGTDQAGPGAQNAITWWDQYAPQKKMETQLFARFAAGEGGLPVNYTVYDPSKMGQALQLAHSSNQLPDVFTLTVSVPPGQLVDQGWFSPLELSTATRKLLPTGSLLPGFSVFGDKTYALPIRTFRQYDALTWYNTDLITRAGIDPTTDLATWDGFRAAARTITRIGGTGVFGWVAPLQFTDRLSAQLTQLALAAGAPGVPDATGLFDPRTGSYLNDCDEMVGALKFLLAMKADRTLYPASSLLDARSARARWATGVVGLFFDGSYNVGALRAQFPSFLDHIGVASIPVAESGRTPRLAQAPTGGGQAFWLSGTTRHAEQATKLISQFATLDVQRQVAEAMDAIPLDLDAVFEANVHPTYRQAAALFKPQVVLAPSPDARSNAVGKVRAKMPSIKPGIGDIVQGAFSGQITDVRAALRAYNTRLTALREQAIASVTKTGVKVGVEDWVFADWQTGTDYDNVSPTNR